jgi:C-terminal processing protease CtpA/Prc
MEFMERRWAIQPRAPRLTAKVAYVTDGSAISAAETHLSIVRHHNIAPIVGGPTAGTNGDVNPFTLPGGFRMEWTGLRVLNHDGSQFHGVGVQPTIPCSRTKEGARAGRDELLERAIQVVRP